MTRIMTTLISLIILALPVGAQEPEGEASSPEAAGIEESKKSAKSPLSASVLAEVSVGAGTFTPGPASRPYVNLLTRVQGSYTFEEVGLSLGLSFSVNVNAMENADSSNTRAHQVKPGDLRISAELEDLLTYTPLGLEVIPTLALVLPTSLESIHVGKIVGIHTGINLSIEPLDWLYLEVRSSFTKNINLSTHAILESDNFDIAPLSRAGGAEAIAEGRVASAGGLTSWFCVWGAGVSFSPLKDFEILIDFEMLHLFSYDAIALDAYSSPYADEGRGQSDLMYGTIEFSYSVIKGLTLALGTIVEQTPLSLDNTSARFPWWDTSNGADNRQVVYFDLIGSF